MATANEMRALVIHATHSDPRQAVGGLEVATLPVPTPAHGQVLVKIAAAPCNPADLMLLEGRYGVKKDFPAVPGFEGAGEVVASGGGTIARWLTGRRVICGGHEATGTWAEYCAVPATSCVPLRRGLSLEQGATAVANPITALAMVDMLRAEGHRAAVQTAAAGQLGRMLLSRATEAGVTMINVVRRPAQADALRDAGAQHVVDSSSEDFDTRLARLCEEHDARVALDAVAGDMTGRLLAALPRHGSVVVYGALSGKPCGAIDPMNLAFGDKRVRGFEIAAWMRRIGLFRSWRLVSKAQKLVAAGSVTTAIQSRLPLEEAREGLLAYLDNMSAGKVLLCPDQLPARE